MGLLGVGSRRNKLSIRTELGVRSATLKNWIVWGGCVLGKILKLMHCMCDKHAVQRGFWVRTQHLLWDREESRKNCV